MNNKLLANRKDENKEFFHIFVVVVFVFVVFVVVVVVDERVINGMKDSKKENKRTYLRFKNVAMTLATTKKTSVQQNDKEQLKTKQKRFQQKQPKKCQPNELTKNIQKTGRHSGKLMKN